MFHLLWKTLHWSPCLSVSLSLSPYLLVFCVSICLALTLSPLLSVSLFLSNTCMLCCPCFLLCTLQYLLLSHGLYNLPFFKPPLLPSHSRPISPSLSVSLSLTLSLPLSPSPYFSLPFLFFYLPLPFLSLTLFLSPPPSVPLFRSQSHSPSSFFSIIYELSDCESLHSHFRCLSVKTFRLGLR